MKLTPAAYRRKYGIPDWRDGKAYPSSLSDGWWRWEFLRRTEDYRMDWERWKPETITWLQGEASNRFTKAWFWKNNHGVDPKGPYFCALMPGSLEKYGLNGLPNPAICEPENIGFYPPVPPDHLTPGAITFGNGRPHVIPGRHAALCIDLAQPIKPQLDSYEDLFRHLAKGQTLQMKSDTRKHRRNYAKYLQVYDARCEGITFAEIGKELSLARDYNEAAARAEECHKAAQGIQQQYIQYPK